MDKIKSHPKVAESVNIMDDKFKEISKDAFSASREAILSMIPVIGSPIQTGLSSFLTERRLKNIEDFNRQLSIDLEQVKSRLPSADCFQQDGVITITETIYEEVETSKAHNKLKYYSAALTNTLLNASSSNFNTETFYTEALIAIPMPYLLILDATVARVTGNSQYSESEQDDYNFEDTVNLNKGAEEFLLNYGFLEREYDQSQTLMKMRMDNSLRGFQSLNDFPTSVPSEPKYYVRVTSLGISFMKFIKNQQNNYN